jgi:hypothetical protein
VLAIVLPSSRLKLSLQSCKKYALLGTNRIPAESIHAGGETLRLEIHNLINSFWNKKELPQQWKGSIIITSYRKGDKTDGSNYQRMSLLSTSYKILSNILLSRLGPYMDEIIGDHQCGFQHNISTTH